MSPQQTSVSLADQGLLSSLRSTRRPRSLWVSEFFSGTLDIENRSLDDTLKSLIIISF